MRIINLYRRIGENYGEYFYEAFVDHETDVTKYSTEFEENGKVNYHMRFQKGVFPLHELEKAYNIGVFQSDIKAANKKWHIRQRKMDLLFRVESIKDKIREFRYNIFNEISTN
jgi:hypothetical protein